MSRLYRLYELDVLPKDAIASAAYGTAIGL
jgi:hypothetical protein